MKGAAREAINSTLRCKMASNVAPANAHYCNCQQPRVAELRQCGVKQQRGLNTIVEMSRHFRKGGGGGFRDGVWADNSTGSLQQLQENRKTVLGAA